MIAMPCARCSRAGIAVVNLIHHDGEPHVCRIMIDHVQAVIPSRLRHRAVALEHSNPLLGAAILILCGILHCGCNGSSISYLHDDQAFGAPATLTMLASKFPAHKCLPTANGIKKLKAAVNDNRFSGNCLYRYSCRRRENDPVKSAEIENVIVYVGKAKKCAERLNQHLSEFKDSFYLLASLVRHCGDARAFGAIPCQVFGSRFSHEMCIIKQCMRLGRGVALEVSFRDGSNTLGVSDDEVSAELKARSDSDPNHVPIRLPVPAPATQQDDEDDAQMKARSDNPPNHMPARLPAPTAQNHDDDNADLKVRSDKHSKYRGKRSRRQADLHPVPPPARAFTADMYNELRMRRAEDFFIRSLNTHANPPEQPAGSIFVGCNRVFSAPNLLETDYGFTQWLWREQGESPRDMLKLQTLLDALAAPTDQDATGAPAGPPADLADDDDEDMTDVIPLPSVGVHLDLRRTS